MWFGWKEPVTEWMQYCLREVLMAGLAFLIASLLAINEFSMMASHYLPILNLESNYWPFTKAWVFLSILTN